MAKLSLLLLALGFFRIAAGLRKPRVFFGTSRFAQTVVKDVGPECTTREEGRVNVIFWINMKESIDRAEHMTTMFQNPSLVDDCMKVLRIWGIPPEEAVGNDDVNELSSGVCTYGWDSPLAGACGSDIAHRVAYSDCQGPGYCLTLEDDSLLTPDWHNKFLNSLHEVPMDWTMIRLGAFGFPAPEDRLQGTHWFRVNRTEEHAYYGAHAIILDEKRANNLVEKLRPEKAVGGDKWTVEVGTYLYEENLVDRIPADSTMVHKQDLE